MRCLMDRVGCTGLDVSQLLVGHSWMHSVLWGGPSHHYTSGQDQIRAFQKHWEDLKISPGLCYTGDLLCDMYLVLRSSYSFTKSSFCGPFKGPWKPIGWVTVPSQYGKDLQRRSQIILWPSAEGKTGCGKFGSHWFGEALQSVWMKCLELVTTVV